MKLLILAACVALAAADVSHLVKSTGENNADIRSQSLDVNPDGSFRWGFETSNGIVANAAGQLNNPQSPDAAAVVQGEAKWISPEGVPVSFEYVADENGYQPQGSAIPTSPPIPEAILRSLQYIKDHPQKEDRV